MDKLIPILEQMAQKTWVDYFAVSAPIVLSVVAIYISISTTRKQNKIALFEKRYELYQKIQQYLILDIAFRSAVHFSDDEFLENMEEGMYLGLREAKLLSPDTETFHSFASEILMFNETYRPVIKSIEFFFGEELSLAFDHLHAEFDNFFFAFSLQKKADATKVHDEFEKFETNSMPLMESQLKL